MKMKFCIATTPIRPVPTYFPPLGSMAIIQSLRTIGVEAKFFNIDYHRHQPPVIEEYFTRHQFDIVGISAVVSTAYAYTKFLAQLIRRVSPRSIIVVGGSLAASAEILMRKCGVDYCVAGDGELVIRELVTTLRDYGRDLEKLKQVKGICYLDSDGQFEFTGFGQRPSAEEIEAPDYSILEEDGCLHHYMPEVTEDRFGDVGGAPFQGGRAAIVTMAKGCVARCTFCHRWEKGYRALPPANIGDQLRYLKERYHITHVDIADENFGSDKKQASQIADLLKELGLVWGAGGVRSNTVTPEELAHWRDTGCKYVNFGTESGSQTILDVMEKRITVQENHNALKWTYEAGLRTVIQMVLGMPGETDRTVSETIQFLNIASDYLYLGDKYPSGLISLNYAQALPGTPLYEHARQHGFIGRGVDDEEKYLLKISDTDAYAEDHFINYTGLPLLKVLMWQQQILAEIDADFLKRRFNTRFSLFGVFKFYTTFIAGRLGARMPALLRRSGRTATAGTATGSGGFIKKSGFYNIREAGKFTPLLLNPLTKRCFTPLLAVGMAFGRKRTQSSVGLLAEYSWWAIKKSLGLGREQDQPTVSLRKIVTILPSQSGAAEDKMMLLRGGR